MTITNYQISDFEVDAMRAILWRHNNAPELTALIQGKQDWYEDNHKQFWVDWFNNVFNLSTADDFGCSVWAIILASPVNINDATPGPVPFGFGMFNQNFGNGNFNPTERNPVFLQTFEKRFVLLLRFWQLFSKGRLVEDNNFLYRLFVNSITVSGIEVWPGMTPGTQPWLYDGLNMTASVTLNSPISPALASVIIEYDLLPRPACVKLNITNSS